MCDASTTRAGGDLSRLQRAYCRSSTQPLSVAVIGDLACGEFPTTLGRLTKFMCCSHTMMHLGQVSMWRRAMGLGSCF